MTTPLEYLQAFEDGKTVEIRWAEDEWRTAGSQRDIVCALAKSRQSGLRIVEPLKLIDMTPFIESGLDCEFSDDGETWAISKLTQIAIEYDRPFGRGNGRSHRYCRPRMNHVHAWNKGDWTVPEGLEGSVQTLAYGAISLLYILVGSALSTNVVSVKFTGVAEGYTLDREEVR